MVGVGASLPLVGFGTRLSFEFDRESCVLEMRAGLKAKGPLRPLSPPDRPTNENDESNALFSFFVVVLFCCLLTAFVLCNMAIIDGLPSCIVYSRHVCVGGHADLLGIDVLWVNLFGCCHGSYVGWLGAFMMVLWYVVEWCVVCDRSAWCRGVVASVC